MGFSIASSASAHKKLVQPLAAFGADDEDEDAEQQQQGCADVAQLATAQDSAAAPPPSAAAAASTAAASAAELVDKGSACAERGDHVAALQHWDQALLLTPDDARVHEMRAQVLDMEGHTYEALHAAQQAVSLRPDWPDGHITLARVQLNYGEPALALLSYQAAARLQPSHPDLAKELPTAQMYAKLHAAQQQQQPGSRAHVVGRMPTRDEQAAWAQEEAEAAAEAPAAGPAGGEDDGDGDDARGVARELLGVLKPSSDAVGASHTAQATARSAALMEVD